MSTSEISLLQKRLNFVPKRNHSFLHTNTTLTTPIKKLEQHLDRKMYFKEHPGNPNTHPFKHKSSWIPLKSKNNSITVFKSELKKEIEQLKQQRIKEPNNMNPLEYEALQNLEKNKEVTIKPANKGGDICIMDTTEYIKKVNDNHLNNNDTYELLDADPTNKISYDVKSLIEYLYVMHFCRTGNSQIF